MIENNLKEISLRVRNATPADWIVDISQDESYLIIRRKNEKNMTESDIMFFENSATDVARLVIEVKQLREVNKALKKQIR
jgi:hypothetical protein